VELINDDDRKHPKNEKKTCIVKKTVIYQQSGFHVKKFVKFNTFVKQINSDI